VEREVFSVLLPAHVSGRHHPTPVSEFAWGGRGTGVAVVLVVVLIYPSMACVVAEGGTGTLDLHKVESTVGQILERDHYTQRKLDSDMTKEILETYLERFDYNKLFFTREDIDQIRNEYRSGIGDDLLLGIAELESLKARIAQLELTVNRNGKPNIWRRPPMPNASQRPIKTLLHFRSAIWPGSLDR
jgi:hypothetical protein